MNVKGFKSHEIIRRGLQILVNLDGKQEMEYRDLRDRIDAVRALILRK